MQQSSVRGIVSMIAAVFFFSLMDACMKHLAAAHSPMQVAFLRGAAGLPVVLAMHAVTREWSDLKAARWPLHIARGLLSVLTLYAFVYALGVLSLADAYSIFLAAPLLVTALSVPVLGEAVGWRRWAAIGVGLAGALIILKPTGEGMATLGGLAAAVAAVAYALNVVLIRVATRTDTAAATVVWTMVVLTVVAGIFAAPQWRAIQPEDWRWIAAIGVTGAIAQFFIVDAFRRCAAGVVAPFEYTALLWGVSLDWLFWQVLPQQRMFLGAAIVIGSGLYVIFRERRTSARA